MNKKTMKAAVLTAFGGTEVIELAERPVPSITKDQVLVRNIATSVNSGDVRIRAKNVPKGYKFLMSLVFGFSKPRKEVLGTVFAGEIVNVGASVTQLKPGDLVFGSTEMKMSTHAEYISIKESAAIADLPKGYGAAESVSQVFGGMTAIYFADKLGLKTGDRILINAAAGSVGIALVQIAAGLGAHVTAIASKRNLDFLIEQGASDVIDYTQTDLTQLASEFDVIADCLGTMPYEKHRRLLHNKGRFALITGTMAEGLAAPFRNLLGSHRIIGGTSIANKSGLMELAKLMTEGTLRPVIDRTFAFDQIHEAHAYVGQGHKRGNVVVSF